MAEQNKTTKEILKAKLSERKRNPLYDRGTLEKLRQGFQKWKKSVVRKEDQQNWHATPHTWVPGFPGKCSTPRSAIRILIIWRI
jgi:hypothetical protein